MDWPTTGNKLPLHPLLIASLNPHCVVKAGAQVRHTHTDCTTSHVKRDYSKMISGQSKSVQLLHQ